MYLHIVNTSVYNLSDTFCYFSPPLRFLWSTVPVRFSYITQLADAGKWCERESIKKSLGNINWEE